MNATEEEEEGEEEKEKEMEGLLVAYFFPMCDGR